MRGGAPHGDRRSRIRINFYQLAEWRVDEGLNIKIGDSKIMVVLETIRENYEPRGGGSTDAALS